MTDARNLCWQCHQPQCACYDGPQSNAPAAEIDWEKRCESLEAEIERLGAALTTETRVSLDFQRQRDKAVSRCRALARADDQARDIATHLMLHSVDCWSYKAELQEAYSWMRDVIKQRGWPKEAKR